MHAPSAPQPRDRRAQGGADLKEWSSTIATVALIVTIYFVVPLGQRDDPLPLAAATAATLATALVLAVLVSRRILRILAGDAGGGLAGLLILLATVIVAFSSGYFLLAQSDPEQMTGLQTRLDAFYFTLITLATIGYGDIHPAGQAARAIASVQVLFNVILLAALVRTTLNQYGSRTSRTPPTRSG